MRKGYPFKLAAMAAVALVLGFGLTTQADAQKRVRW